MRDTEYLARNAFINGYQLASLLAPPFYVALTLARSGRRSFSVNHLLRATWLSGLGGGLTSSGLSYAWYTNCREDQLRAKRLKIAYDNDRMIAEDHATIGAILSAVLTPALFWHRARPVNLMLGGAGLGSSIGLITYYGRLLIGDEPPTSSPTDAT